MLWFQGAIPAAIASAKSSGAVFVVFVAGEEGWGPRHGRTPSPAYLQPQGPTAFATGCPSLAFQWLPRPLGLQRAWLLPPERKALSQPQPRSPEPRRPLAA